MRLPVEPACYAWAEEDDAVAAYPPQAFIDGVMWLESFFSWNPHCRIPMTADLRNAVGRLFPYGAAAAAGRIGTAQELVGTITRLIDRVRILPDFEYNASESRVAGLRLVRTAHVYVDEDVWLSWCDLLAQCIAFSEAHRETLHIFTAWVNSCVECVSRRGEESICWIRGGRDTLPDGTVDPNAMQAMRSRWRRCARPIAWEDSGHQPPVQIKRLISRVVDDCEGIVLRFGSTYFNPALSVRCAVTSCGTDGDRVSQLDCAASDGVVTLRGVFRTTAETETEQSAALSFVRQRLRERCAEAGFEFDP